MELMTLFLRKNKKYDVIILFAFHNQFAYADWR